MKTVQIICIILILFCAPEAESKLWILKLFQKAASSIRGMKEGSAAASAVAVAAVGGGAVADTIISMNAEEKTPIAGAQKTLSEDILEPSILNDTVSANETIPNNGENENTTPKSRYIPKVRTPTNTRLVEIEVPCDSKRGTGNKANPVQEGMPDGNVGRHSHRWFEKHYGQNANKRVCKTFVEVPIHSFNASEENVSNQNETSQTVDEVKSNNTVQDVSGMKIHISEIDDQNLNGDVTKSYEDIYVRPIMKFNHDVPNSESDGQNINSEVTKSNNNVYIRPIIKFYQDVTQPSQPYNNPIIPYNNVHIRPIMKFNQDVTQPSQPKIVTETPDVHDVPKQSQSTVGIVHAEDFESEEIFPNNALNTSSEHINAPVETKQTTQPQIGSHTPEVQNTSEQPQATLGIADAEESETGQLFINDKVNGSIIDSDGAEENQQPVQPQKITQSVQPQMVTQTIKPQTVAQTVQQQTATWSVQPQTVTQTTQLQTSTHTIRSEVKQAEQDVPKYSYMRNMRINGHDIEQDDYSSKENILFTSGVNVSQTSYPWIIIALAVLFGMF